MAPEKDLLDELSNISVISHSSFVSRLLKVYLDSLHADSTCDRAGFSLRPG